MLAIEKDTLLALRFVIFNRFDCELTILKFIKLTKLVLYKLHWDIILLFIKDTKLPETAP